MRKKLIMAVLPLFILAACATGSPTVGVTQPIPDQEPTTLSVMTHDSFSASETIIQAFEKANNVKLSIIKSGDSGAALNKAILAKGNPLADVFYGVDSTFLSRALDADIFEPYTVRSADDLRAYQLDTAQPARVTPINYGDVCINYDKAYFAQNNLAVPQNLEDLVKPEYRSMLVVQNPATSSPGLAFMLASIKHFGNENWLPFWKGLRANDVKIVDGWETAYYTEFSASSGKGPRPMVVSYASSPPAEVVFAADTPTDAPTASIVGDGACYRQIEYVGILKGTRNSELARAFIEFLVSIEFQEDMPLQMFVFPVNLQARLPDAFTKYAQIPTNPATLAPDEVAANRESWIQQWTEMMLR